MAITKKTTTKKTPTAAKPTTPTAAKPTNQEPEKKEIPSLENQAVAKEIPKRKVPAEVTTETGTINKTEEQTVDNPQIQEQTIKQKADNPNNNLNPTAFRPSARSRIYNVSVNGRIRYLTRDSIVALSADKKNKIEYLDESRPVFEDQKPCKDC